MFPTVADRLHVTDATLSHIPAGSPPFDLVTSVQTLYYLSEHDCTRVLDALRQSSRPRGIVYVTWMGSVGHYWDASTVGLDGMRHVTYTDNRIKVDEHIRFAESRDHLEHMLPMIEVLECGRYLQSFRSRDFGNESFHYALTGRWR
jgi:hypothetical protein